MRPYKSKKWLSLLLTLSVVTLMGLGAIVYAATATPEPETAVKRSLYGLTYDHFLNDTTKYLDGQWTKMDKLSANMTRKDAAYLLVSLYATMTGSDLETIDYATKISDSTDVMLRRSYDLGLLSLNAYKQILPNDPVTQEEFSVLLTKVAKRLNVYKASTTKLGYADASKISSWAKEPIQYLTDAKAYGFVSSNQLEPKKIITQQRALAMVERFMVSVKFSGDQRAAAFTRTVGDFKVPEIDKSVMDYYKDKDGHFTLFFTGVMPFASTMDYKSALCQIPEVLDTNSDISSTAIHKTFEVIVAHFDQDNRTFKFDNDYYISAKTGDVSMTKPSAPYLHISADAVLLLDYVD